MEDAQFILAQQLFHQVQQLQSACRQVGAVVDLFGTAAHAPPVIHRPGTAAVVVPGAVKNGADDLNIEGFPFPHRQAQRLQRAVRPTAAQTVIPVGTFRLLPAVGIENVHVRAVREIQRVGRVWQAGPAQQHPRAGAHRLEAQCEGVDCRRDAVHRVGRHIAHPIGAGKRTGQQAQQVGHLIGAGIVGAHQRMRRVQRAVQDAGLGVLGRHLQAGRVHPGTGGEDHIRVVVGYVLQDLFRVHLRVHILPAGNRQPVRKFLFQRRTALVVVAHPGAVLGIVLMQEHHLELTGPGAENVQLGQQRLAGALGRLQ